MSSDSSSIFCEFPPFSPFSEFERLGTSEASEAGLAVVSETVEPGDEVAGLLFWKRNARRELIFTIFRENESFHTKFCTGAFYSKVVVSKQSVVL